MHHSLDSTAPAVIAASESELLDAGIMQVYAMRRIRQVSS